MGPPLSSRGAIASSSRYFRSRGSHARSKPAATTASASYFTTSTTSTPGTVTKSHIACLCPSSWAGTVCSMRPRSPLMVTRWCRWSSAPFGTS